MSGLLSGLKEQRDDLTDRIAALDAEAKPIRDQVSNIDRTRSKLLNEKSKIVEQINELSKKPRVSDHAVIRYLERQHGFSFEAVRDEMLTPVILEAMNAQVDSVKALGGTVKLSGKTLVTFTP